MTTSAYYIADVRSRLSRMDAISRQLYSREIRYLNAQLKSVSEFLPAWNPD